MSTYVVGDVQGCLEALRALLAQVGFGTGDRLWLTGDLVNRGPDSLGVLRFVQSLGERAVTVLGNHDLHLLAAARDPERHLKRKDTLGPILEAPDREELLRWLRHRPLLHRDTALGFTMVHAGLPPEWSVAEAAAHARELEAVLAGPGWGDYLETMYGDQPRRWRDDLEGEARLRFITNAFTRMRYWHPQEGLWMGDKGPPGTQPEGVLPWFAVPGRASSGEDIVFGHWSTLQLHGPVSPAHRVHPLDTGCLWGGRLTALRLEDRATFSLDCGPVCAVD